MITSQKSKINLMVIALAGLLLASFASLFLIPYLRKIFNDWSIPSFNKEITLYFFLISTIQIILYYFLLKLSDDDFKNHFIILLFFALTAAAIFFILPPQGAVDITNNAFFSKILVDYGANPYLHPIKEFSDDIFFPATNPWWKGVTAYGPAWTLLSIIPYKLSGPLLAQKIFAFRVFNLAFWGAAGFLIFSILKKTKPKFAHKATLAYLLNPLILFEAVNNSHNDLVFVFFILLAIYFYFDNKISLVLPFLTISFLIKYTSLAIFPFFLWPMWNNKKNNKKILLVGILLSLTIIILSLWPFSFNWKAMLASLENQTTLLYNPYYLSTVPLFFFSIFSHFGQSFEMTKVLSFSLFVIGYILLLITSLKKGTPVASSFWVLGLLLIAATFWLQPWYFLWLLPLIILNMEKPFFNFLLFSLSLAGLLTYGLYPFPPGITIFILVGIILISKITEQKWILLSKDG